MKTAIVGLGCSGSERVIGILNQVVPCISEVGPHEFNIGQYSKMDYISITGANLCEFKRNEFRFILCIRDTTKQAADQKARLDEIAGDACLASLEDSVSKNTRDLLSNIRKSGPILIIETDSVPNDVPKYAKMLANFVGIKKPDHIVKMKAAKID